MTGTKHDSATGESSGRHSGVDATVSALLDALRAEDVCVEFSARSLGYPWVRRLDGEWRVVSTSAGIDTTRVESPHDVADGTVWGAERVRDELATRSFQLVEPSDATLPCGSDTRIWQLAFEQGVFDDVRRCVWCGTPDWMHSLAEWATEDGDRVLCRDCYETWQADDCIRDDRSPAGVYDADGTVLGRATDDGVTGARAVFEAVLARESLTTVGSPDIADALTASSDLAVHTASGDSHARFFHDGDRFRREGWIGSGESHVHPCQRDDVHDAIRASRRVRMEVREA